MGRRWVVRGTRRVPAAPAFGLAVLLLATAACTSNPSPAPSPSAAATPATTAQPTPAGSQRPAAEVYAQIREEVAAIRRLQATTKVEPVVIDTEQLRRNLEAEYDTSYTVEQVEFLQDLWLTLGLLPAGSSLRELQLDLMAGQVAGYYSPERDELYVVGRSGGLGALERATYAHEFTHQLQDQSFDLNSLALDAAGASDRGLARLALVEGDATLAQQTWMQGALTADELAELLTASLDPVALDALTRAPRILQQEAMFPYQQGLVFVSSLMASGGLDAVDRAFANPPDSTEQLLHPDKYFDRESPMAVDVKLDAAARLGTGWSEAGQDTLGEFVLRVWLREAGVGATLATSAAAGWGGDRAVLYRGPNGTRAVVVVSEWDTQADAAEFAVAVLGSGPVVSGECHVLREPGSRRVGLGCGVGAKVLIEALAQPG